MQRCRYGSFLVDAITAPATRPSRSLYSGRAKWDKKPVTPTQPNTQPNFHSTPIPSGSEPFPEVVLTLAEAAWASGLTRDELQQSVRSGELRVRRIARGGRVVSVVAMKELERVHLSITTEREQTEESIQLSNQAMREQLARLEGELDASSRVERSLQRYTDRLEERMAVRVSELENSLAISRQRELTLARALGRIEGQYTRLSGQIAAESDEVADDGPVVQEPVAR